MVHDGRWGKEREKFIPHWRDEIIKDSLGGFKNVVVDDTNFAPKHEITLRAIAEVYKADFEVKFFDTPVEECIKRDLARPNSVGEKVIRQMYDQYLKPKPEIYIPPIGKPKAIMCDIDGTLAHMNGRGPYEWDKVDTDTIDETVANAIRYYAPSHGIIFLSGRDGSCYEKTRKWLSDHKLPTYALHMRAEGDNRKDFIIKRELFDIYIRDSYQVEFVLDDRDQVIQLWRSMGLKAFQVADGGF